ncbi:Conserved hypothetical protein, GGDEF domain [Herminiimonas arsenicoxydans]|uniref:GGDEF domain-containing protein n=1 Tax=Herminiimonas arsenicoxydans TaxID=204773 RepID=A4G5K3_HERAR|nr:Conserved hypothetical protein, GGDEF domain [Herminiimonas arsenicoxydans]
MPSMKTKRAPTIRSKLLLLVIACVVPAALMAVALITYEYQRTREQLSQTLLGTARAMMSGVDRDLASIESSLVALATSPYLAANDFRTFYDQARQVLAARAEDDDINIALLDITGKQHLNTRRPFGAPLPVQSYFPGLKTIYEDGKPVITDLFIGQVTLTPILVIGVPVYINGKVAYNLNAGIFPQRFEELLQQQKLPAGWIAAIFDSKGTIVARTSEMQRFVGKKATPEIIENISANNEKIFSSTTYDGITMHTVLSHSEISNWSIAIGIPNEAFTLELRNTLLKLILATLILLAGSLAIAWMIGGRIAASIRGLTGPALELGRGKKVHVPPLHLREADEVGGSLIRASEMLQKAQHQANHDVLTGLANRGLFDEIVNQQLALCERNQTSLSVLYIDLDGFKAVNDAYGHETGDQLLCEVAARLKASSRHSDLVARLGGDEFAIVMVGTGLKDAAFFAEKLVESLSAVYVFGNLSAHISASIGVASYPDCALTSDALLQYADRAMYQAKGAGRRQAVMAPPAERM